jgi:hypothetical protein
MNDWVKVDDRLPEEEESVLLCDGFSICIGHIFDSENKYWWNSPDIMMNDITHWMPLPELPSKEDK